MHTSEVAGLGKRMAGFRCLKQINQSERQAWSRLSSASSVKKGSVDRLASSASTTSGETRVRIKELFVQIEREQADREGWQKA